MCQNNNTWEPIPGCIVVDCGNITDVPENTFTINETGTTFKSIANYKCIDGYTLEGNNSTDELVFYECSEDGIWIENGTCIPITCDQFIMPNHSNHLDEQGERISFGTSINVTCVHGYVIDGLNSSTRTMSCDTNGTWDAVECVRVVCDPNSFNIPEKAEVLNSTEFVIKVVCMEGYNINGNNYVDCTANGTWDDGPSCQIVECGVFVQPLHSIINETGQQYGDNITIECENNFELDGPDKVTCLSNGSWEEGPICKPLCGNYTVPDNANIVEINNQLLNFSCKSGYELDSADSFIVCNDDNTWEKMPDCLAIDCGNLTNIPGKLQIVNQTGTTAGSKVTFSCEVGYKLEGNDSIYCQTNKQWEDYPSCAIIECEYPQESNNSFVIANSTTVNSTATVHCKSGYFLSGNDKITCFENGTWSQSPVCNIVDCKDNLPVLENGYVVEPYNTTFGSVIEFECNDNFSLGFEESSLQCGEEGTWKGRPPVCTSIGNVTFAEEVFVLQNEGVSYITCEINDAVNWTAILVMKNEPIILINRTSGANQTQFGAFSLTPESDFTADSAFLKIRVNPVSCDIEGKYSCGVSTGNAFKVDEADVVVQTSPKQPSLNLPSSVYIGSPVDLVCSGSIGRLERNVSVANLSLRVLNKTDGTFTTITETLSLETSESSCEIEATVTARVDVDESLNGSVIQCVNQYANGTVLSSANKTIFAVNPIGCDGENSVDNGTVTTTNITMDGHIVNIAKIECNVGFTLGGNNSQINCTGDNSWPIFPTCDLVECNPDEYSIKDGQISDSSSYSFGISLNVSCNVGYVLNGPDTIECMANGSWSGPPICEPVTCSSVRVENGFVIDEFEQSESVVGSIFKIDCDVGYVISGSDEVECLTTGNWSTNATCQLVNCDTYDPPPNSNMASSNGTVYLSVVVINCTEGYRLSGNGENSVKCNQEGFWEGSPMCTSIGLVTFGQERYEFQRGSNATVTCEATGIQDWTAMAVNIGNQPIILINKTGESNLTTYPPFFLASQSNITDDTAQLQIAIQPVGCEVEGDYRFFVRINNMQGDFAETQILVQSEATEPEMVVPDIIYINDSATLQCVGMVGRIDKGVPESNLSIEVLYEGTSSFQAIEQGLRNSPPVENDCQIEETLTADIRAESRWNNSIIRCKSENKEGNVLFSPNRTIVLQSPKGCTENPELENGNVKVNNNSQIITAYFECDDGYVLDGPYAINCSSNNVWPTFPSCEPVNCGPYNDTILHGQVSDSLNNSLGAILNITCDFGYETNGAATFECTRMGNWTDSPKCILVQCPESPNVTNGVVLEYTTRTWNSTYDVNCDQGYILEGSATVKCLATGNWSDYPTCNLVDCGPYNYTGNGNAMSNGTVYGSVVTLECDPGYDLVGRENATCDDDGNWTSGYDCSSIAISLDQEQYTVELNSSVEIGCTFSNAPNWTTVIFLNIRNPSENVSITWSSGQLLNKTTPGLEVLPRSDFTEDSGTAVFRLHRNSSEDCSSSETYGCLVTTQEVDLSDTLDFSASNFDSALVNTTCNS